MTQEYLVVYEKGAENWSGYSPQVPGCVSVGRTLEEMRSMMTEALEFHLGSMLEDGDPLPDASAVTSVDFAEESRTNGVEHCHVEWLPVRISSEFSGAHITANQHLTLPQDENAEIYAGAMRSIYTATGIQPPQQPNEKTHA